MSATRNKNISIIVAIAENHAIGKDNKLLWHLSDDLKRFKQITTGHTIIMGKRTYESLPNGALPNRTNLVITDVEGESFEGCKVAYSIEEALNQVEDNQEAFIIGGGMIYKQFLPHSRKLYLTKVDVNIAGDTFFPHINYDEWNEVHREKVPASDKNEFSHSFVILERK